jgi:Uncharacterized bacitracin resistance protein
MLDAIIIGIIQGLTEFLPISSTGHMLIYQIFVENQHSDAFNVLIQVGSILAALTVFLARYTEFFSLERPCSKGLCYKIICLFLHNGGGRPYSESDGAKTA